MLQQATNNDIHFFYSLYMHPQINPYLLYELMDENEFKPIYKNLLDENVLYKFIVNKEEVGMCKLISQKYRDAHKLYIGGFAIDVNQAGKNYGFLMLQAIIALAKEKSKTRVELTVSTQNEKAIALYKKCGFKIEGALKNFTYLKGQNKYIDEYMMALIL
jgi:RimJ/RimL family protein N-acetyltransferase